MAVEGIGDSEHKSGRKLSGPPFNLTVHAV